MRCKAAILLSVVIFGAALALTARGETACEKVGRQFREYCLGDSTDRGDRLLDDVELPKTPASMAVSLLQKQKADGSWPDINYAAEGRGSWETYNHLVRTLALVLYARRDPTSADTGAYMTAVHKALGFWAKSDYRCPNWWYNVIGVPKILGTIDLLMDKDLTAEERKYFVGTVMPRSKLGAMTGQNRVWIAGNDVMLAAVTDDDALLGKASKIIAEEIRVAPENVEGIQADESFHQHGPQQQFGNYGMAFCVDMTRWAVVLRGTAAAIPEGRIAVLRDYLLGGENWVTWKGTMDISSCGRQLFVHAPAAKGATIAAVMATMAIVDPGHSADYGAFDKRNKAGAENDLVGDRYFFRSDYLVHRTGTEMVTLRMRSERVIGGETVNSENVSGRHLADGAMFFYQAGEEYTDIFPVWNWHEIPGTTAVQGEKSLEWPKKKAAKGKAAAEVAPDPADVPKDTPHEKVDASRGTSFVGAVSDGVNSAAGMDFAAFEGSDLKAKKSYFLFGDLTVCLGAGINSSSDMDVVTTVNQSLLQGEVAAEVGGERKVVSHGEVKLVSPRWVEQDHYRYVFPTETTVTVRSGAVTGNWKKVFDSSSTPKGDVTKDAFTLLIDHGVRPRDGGYAYFVLPSSEKFEKRVEILSNTAKVQAVRIDGKWVGAVFYEAGKLEGEGYSVEVEEPCVMCMEAGGENPQVWVSDPTQKLEKIGISAGGSFVEQKLPTGTLAGKTVELGKE